MEKSRSYGWRYSSKTTKQHSPEVNIETQGNLQRQVEQMLNEQEMNVLCIRQKEKRLIFTMADFDSVEISDIIISEIKNHYHFLYFDNL